MNSMFNQNPWREDFPILNEENQRKFVYMDSASTSLKPEIVRNAVNRFYVQCTSNVSRASHFLSEEIFEIFDQVREKVASFINAKKSEIIFTHNCTDSINLVANGLTLNKNDEVILSILEHHSNFLPWYERTCLKIISLDEQGLIDLNSLKKLITNKTKLITVPYISNVTGNIQPVKEIAKLARENGILCLIDAAQAAGHIPIDVFDIDCDFLAFSSHKMLGPNGVGILYVKNEIQQLLSPSKQGGGVVNKIEPNKVEYLSGYSLFEAGTPNIEGILGLGAAIDYIDLIDINNVLSYLQKLESYCRMQLESLTSIYLPFTISNNHSPIFSFRPKNSKTEMAFITRTLSDVHKIALREGYQCAQPLYNSKTLNGSIRISLYLYNTFEEIDYLINALKSLHNLMI